MMAMDAVRLLVLSIALAVSVGHRSRQTSTARRCRTCVVRWSARTAAQAPWRAIRGLVETILFEPDGNKLKITLKGDLGGLLSAARDSKRSPDTGDLFVQNKAGCGGSQPLIPTALYIVAA